MPISTPIPLVAPRIGFSNHIVTGQGYEPLSARCSTDSYGFNSYFNRSREKEFEPTHVFNIEIPSRKLPACLLKREGLVSIISSKSWETNFSLPLLNPAKESLKCPIKPFENILKDLRTYSFKLRKFSFKMWEFGYLVIARNGFFALIVNTNSLLQPQIVEDTTKFLPSETIVLSLLVYLGFIEKSLFHCLLCASIYLLIVSLLTLPAVDAKYDVVHIEGSLSNCGNSFLKILAEYHFKRNMIWFGAMLGKQFTNRCTWSGWISRATMSMESSFAFSSNNCFKRDAILPVKTGLRLRGIQTKW